MISRNNKSKRFFEKYVFLFSVKIHVFNLKFYKKTFFKFFRKNIILQSNTTKINYKYNQN